MPTVFTKYGYRFHFYSNQGNEPPHIHITGKNGEMKVWLKNLEVAFSYHIQPRDRKRILDAIYENRKLLMEKWNEFSSKKRK